MSQNFIYKLKRLINFANVTFKFSKQMKKLAFTKPTMGIVMFLLTFAIFGCQNQVEEPMFTESDQMAGMPLSRSASGDIPFLQGQICLM